MCQRTFVFRCQKGTGWYGKKEIRRPSLRGCQEETGHIHSSPIAFSCDVMRNYPGLTPTGKSQRSPSEECKALNKAHSLSEECKALHKMGNCFDDSIWLAIPQS